MSSSALPEIPARFARTAALYGSRAFARIRAAHVTVVGVGGVGSHAALALARSGVGGLHLIDFDHVTPSSLNRFPFAGEAEIGRIKVEVMAEHLARFCPDTRVRVSAVGFDALISGELLSPLPDLVVDALDNVTAKVDLLAACVERAIPVASSMGAAARRKGGEVRVDDLAATRGCPLARTVRGRLRARGITTGILCVYSIEPPGGRVETAAGAAGRPPLPSAIAVPGIFGYALASAALDRIAEGGPGPPVDRFPRA